jgi:hypothetical protein
MEKRAIGCYCVVLATWAATARAGEKSIWYAPDRGLVSGANCVIADQSPAQFYELMRSPNPEILDYGARVDIHHTFWGTRYSMLFFRDVISCMKAIAAQAEVGKRQNEQRENYLSKYR